MVKKIHILDDSYKKLENIFIEFFILSIFDYKYLKFESL